MKRQAWKHWLAIGGVVYGLVIGNLYLQQHAMLNQAERHFADGNQQMGLFTVGQCLRSRPPLLGYTERCHRLAEQKLAEMPQTPDLQANRDYIEGYKQATAHFNETAAGLTFLLHLSFLAFVVLIFWMLLRTQRSRRKPWLQIGFAALAFLTWIWCGYVIR